MDNTERLKLAINELNQVNDQMKKLNATKLVLESEIIDLVGAKEEGSTTVKSGMFKVQTTGALRRSVLPGVTMEDIVTAVGEETAKELLKEKWSINLSLYRKLEEKQRRNLDHLIVSKPAKTAVKLELLDGSD